MTRTDAEVELEISECKIRLKQLKDIKRLQKEVHEMRLLNFTAKPDIADVAYMVVLFMFFPVTIPLILFANRE